MKLVLLLVIGVAGAVGIGSAVYLKSATPPDVVITTGPKGLTSIKADKTEYLLGGDFRVDEVTLKGPDGTLHPGPVNGAGSFDQSGRVLTISYPWGTVATTYTTNHNRLTLSIKTTNASSTDSIEGIRLTPLALKFPEKVKEYDGSIPLLAHNIGQLGVVPLSYGSGTLVVAADDVEKPLMVGFPWALDKPANTQYPLSVHTDRVRAYPDSYPTITRPIPPKGSDEYIVSLRFGRKRTTEAELSGDLDKRYAEVFPAQLKWTDRRPIGAIFLAVGPQEWTNNPRGWFGDANLDVSKPAGQAEFRRHILALADGAIAIMKEMNAQGAITWDIEGQQYRHATTYIGDPRVVETLAPEMAGVVDEYFGRFKSAGLRTGICVRPQQLRVAPDRKTAEQLPIDDPTQLLIDKIAYAKKRWGISLVYLDSNVKGVDANPLDVSIIRKVTAQFPDVLLIPEHSNLQYYAYSAPFGELRRGIFSTPEATRNIYPQAFSAIYTADGPLDLYRDGLKSAVKHGDSLMYRTWFKDPQNDKVREIYK